MIRQMFQSVSSQEPLGTRQRYTVPLSIAAHAALLAVLVVVPLVATGAIPAPSSVLVFTAPSVVPPQPPPPASTAIPPPRVDTEFSPDAAPTVAPSTVGPEPLPTFAPTVGGIPPIAELTTASGPGIAPPAPAAIDTPRRVGGDVQPPRKIADVPPIYPAMARAARVAGDVILEATIAKDGSVRDVKVLRSVPMLDDAAMSAVRAWRYTAPTLNGTPIEVLMTVTVRFGLR